MKKTLIIGLLGLAASVAPSFGQGIIALDNYLSNGGNNGPGFVLYGQAGIPANGTSGGAGTSGSGIVAGWTVGFYWVAGNQVANVTPDATGTAVPAGGGLALATGSGSTAPSFAFSTPGTYEATAAYATAGVAAGGTITMELIAYNTSAGSYANAGYRGHSTAFTMTVADPTGAPNLSGNFAPSFNVLPVPEPTTFALSGLGAAALLFFRRKK